MSKIPRISGMGIEHVIVCINFFGVLICTTGDVLWLC